MIPELFINKNSEFTFVSFSSSHSLVCWDMNACMPGDMDTIIGKETWEKHFSRKSNKKTSQTRPNRPISLQPKKSELESKNQNLYL